MNLVPALAIAALGYVAYKFYYPDKDKPKETQPMIGPLPVGVRFQKTDKGADFAEFEPKYRDVLLAGLTAQTNEVIPSSKGDGGPFALAPRAAGWPVSSFDFARERSGGGKWVLVPQTLALRYVNGEEVKPEEALILSVADETSLAMFSKSGWAVIASPGSLQWSEGMTNTEVFDKLSGSGDFTPSSGWTVRSTPAAMNPVELLSMYGQHLAAKNAGGNENLTLSFAVTGAEGDTIAAGNLAATMTLKDGVRMYPVVSIDQGAYPAPIPGTPFLVPETSVVLARRTPA